jgi:hypothetical protein
MKDELLIQLRQQQKDYQDTLLKGYELGKKDTLEKVKTLSSLWAGGKLSEEDFAIKLNELFQDPFKEEQRLAELTHYGETK